MSYCRWQNTLTDLRDCAADLEERRSDACYLYLDPEERQRPLSPEEHAAMLAVLYLCRDMLEEVGLEVEGDIDGLEGL